MPRRVLIDTDPGVDDAMAIFMALASPELEVVGLTSVFGNAGIDTTTRNALVLLDIAGRGDVPVTRGASSPIASDYPGPVPQVHGTNGLGDAELPETVSDARRGDAADFMVATARAFAGEITLLMLGPLSNLAVALDRYPDLPGLVREVVVMGGNALVPGNATPTAEANIHNDPEAADLVFGTPWRVTMIGLDVTHRLNLSGNAIDRITGAPTPTSRFLARAVPHYRDFFERSNGLDGIYAHDPATVAYLVDPSAFSAECWPLRVETESFSRGKTWPCLGGTDEATPRAWRGRPGVRVCVDVDATRVLGLIESRLVEGP